MKSITKIFILIIGIIDIRGDEAFNSSNDTGLASGEALNSSNDTDLPSSRVSDSDLLDTLEFITTDKSIINPLDSDIRPKRESIDIMTIGSKRGIRRERQQALVKTKGSDDEPNSVMPLLARPSSPLKIHDKKQKSSIGLNTSDIFQ